MKILLHFLIVCALTWTCRAHGPNQSQQSACNLMGYLKSGCKPGASLDSDDQVYGNGLGTVTDCPPNVVFVLDGSDSVSPNGYRLAQESLIREIRTVTQTFANTNIGVILFSDETDEIPLQNRTPEQINDLVNQIQSFKQPRKKTFLSEAITNAKQMLLDYSRTESRAYNGVRSGSVIVLLTDGNADNNRETAQVVEMAKNSGILIVSLSVEDADVRFLKEISCLVQDHRQALNWKSLVVCPGKVLEPIQKGRECRDFLFVVDGSDSVLRHKETVRQYLAYTARRYRMVPNAIGVNVFGTNSKVQPANTRIRLEDDKYDLSDKIQQKLVFPTSGGTGTDRAIAQSVDMLNDDLRDKPSALILITDGPTFDPTATRNAIQKSRDNGYPVIIIRVGKVLPDEELNFIAGADSSNVFSVDSFTDVFSVDFDGSICGECRNRCPINSRQTAQCGCACSDSSLSYNRNINECVCPQECPNNARRINSCACECLDSSQTYNSTTNTCGTRTNTCSQVCPSNTYRGSDCSCVCLDGLYFNVNTRTCVCPQECPSNARRMNTCACECLDNSQTYNSTTNTCVTRTNTCSLVCPTNAYRGSDCSCVCLDGLYFNVNTRTCVCPQECPSNARRTNTCGCECLDSSQTYNSTTNTCVTRTNTCSLVCPTNAYRGSDCSCVCLDGLYFNVNTRTCVCPQECPSNARRTNTCGCECLDSSQTYNSTTNTCVTRTNTCSQECPSNAYRGSDCSCVCLDGLYFNWNTRTCVCPQECPSNARRINSCACECLDNNQSYNSTTNTCVTRTNTCSQVCPPNAYLGSDCSCVCLDGKYFNSNTRTCVCPQECPNNARRINQCACECLDSSQSYNSITNTCVTRTNTCSQVCPSNAYLSSDCSCVCLDGLYFNVNTRTCVCPQECPSNARRINTCACECLDSSQSYNSSTNTCVTRTNTCTQVCPFNAYLGSDCSCICLDGKYFNANTRTCECGNRCPVDSWRSYECACVCWGDSLVYNNRTNSCVNPACSKECPSNARGLANCDCQCLDNNQVYNYSTNQCESEREQCSKSELTCENNQVAYRDCNGHCFCACSAGFAGTRCEIVLQAELCNDCYFDNGHYHAGVVGYCDLYVNCVPVDGFTNTTARPTSFVPYIMSCPLGTLYITRPDGWKGCDFVTNGRCSQDRCETLPANARYADSSACQSYWQCGADRRLTSRQCCSPEERFDQISSRCVPDSSCPVTCGTNRTTACNDTRNQTDTDYECPFNVNENNPNEYFYTERPGELHHCQTSDIMNLTLCRCVTGSSSTPIGCSPVVNLTFEQATRGGDDNVPRIPVIGGQSANFSGPDDITFRAFAGSGFWTDYFQINLRLYLPRPVQGGQQTAVTTNADCNREESVAITMDDTNFYFKVYQIGYNESAEIVIPYNGRADIDGWYSVTLLYRRVNGQFQFSGTVGSYTQMYNGSIPLSANIDYRTCALHLGQGYRYAGLIAYVDDFQVWRCDPRTA